MHKIWRKIEKKKSWQSEKAKNRQKLDKQNGEKSIRTGKKLQLIKKNGQNKMTKS